MIELEFFDENNLYNELAHDYWQLGEQDKFIYTVKQLQSKYELKQSEIIKAVQSVVIAYDMNICCSECGAARVCNSRSDYTYTPSYFSNNWVCQDCINNEKQMLIENKQEILASHKLREKRAICDLSVKDLAYLVTLIKHSSYDNGITINNVVSDKSYLLTPSIELDRELLRVIDDKNICILSDKNPLSNLQENENGGYSYNLFNILRDVWVDVYNGIGDLEVLETILIDKIKANSEEFFELLEEISVHECLSYMRLNVEKRSLSITLSDRSEILIKKMLIKFPVNIIWGIIFSSIKNTSDYILQNKGTFKSRNESYIAGVLYNKIENYFERALANNWSLKPYNRDFNLPQSSLSRLLFNTILKTDDGGFSRNIYELYNDFIQSDDIDNIQNIIQIKCDDAV
jgi:hypothetical protein